MMILAALLKIFISSEYNTTNPKRSTSPCENSIAVWREDDEKRIIEESNIMEEFAEREKSIIPIIGLFLDKCTEYNDRFKVVFLVHQNFGVIKSAIDWYCADQADLQLRRRPAWIQGLVLHQPHRQV